MRHGWIGVLALVVVPAIISRAATQYSVTLLGNANGSDVSNVNGVSTFGAAGGAFVGDSNTLQGNFEPVIWQGSAASLLPVPAGYYGSASSINSSGDATGYVFTNDVNVAQPAVWHNGQLNMLGTLNMPSGNAYAINDQGIVVGAANDLLNPVPQSEAVMWSGGQATVLGSFPAAQSWAPAINNRGQILVLASSPQETDTWVWTGGSLTQITSLGGRSLGGVGINDLGHVAGTAVDANDNTVGFFWKDGTTTALPNLQGDAYAFVAAINNNDQIVGEGGDGINGSHAVLWQNGQAFNLNDLLPANSGWYLSDATGIASDGTIVGYGSFDGEAANFELTSSGSPSGTASVPEPATLGVLGIAGMLLLWRRRSV